MADAVGTPAATGALAVPSPSPRRPRWPLLLALALLASSAYPGGRAATKLMAERAARAAEAQERQEVERRLASQKVVIHCEKESIREALEIVRELVGVPFVSPTDWADVTSTTVSIEGSVAEAVGAIAPDAAVEVWRGVVFVMPRSEPLEVPPAPELSPVERSRFGSDLVTVRFSRTPLEEVAAFYRAEAHLDLACAAGARRRTVSLQLKNVRLGMSLDVVCRLARVSLERDGERFVLVPR